MKVTQMLLLPLVNYHKNGSKTSSSSRSSSSRSSSICVNFILILLYFCFNFVLFLFQFGCNFLSIYWSIKLDTPFPKPFRTFEFLGRFFKPPPSNPFFQFLRPPPLRRAPRTAESRPPSRRAAVAPAAAAAAAKIKFVLFRKSLHGANKKRKTKYKRSCRKEFCLEKLMETPLFVHRRILKHREFKVTFTKFGM